jgi:putative PIN family toxin of toxin-antitoxin system
MLRVVIDTNVIVSGLLSRTGAPAEILDAWRGRQFLMLSSAAIISEVKAVLGYPRIKERYSITAEAIDQVVALLEQHALLVDGGDAAAGSIPADPRDEMFLACAQAGGADYIVSGDHHLLDLNETYGIPVLNARDFLELLKKK